jgi:hypothetical protein
MLAHKIRGGLIVSVAFATVAFMSSSASALSPTGGLVGTWLNVDSNANGTVKIVISNGANGTLKVHTYGACSPTPCDNGTKTALDYSASVDSSRAKAFTFTANAGFMSEIMTGVLKSGRLVVTDFSHFTDGSGRYDYVITDTFAKQ